MVGISKYPLWSLRHRESSYLSAGGQFYYRLILPTSPSSSRDVEKMSQNLNLATKSQFELLLTQEEDHEGAHGGSVAVPRESSDRRRKRLECLPGMACSVEKWRVEMVGVSEWVAEVYLVEGDYSTWCRREETTELIAPHLVSRFSFSLSSAPSNPDMH